MEERAEDGSAYGNGGKIRQGLFDKNLVTVYIDYPKNM